MSYPYAHLFIAKALLDLRPDFIHNAPQYYLGCIAPDAVHHRAVFLEADKAASHLLPKDSRIGDVGIDELRRCLAELISHYRNSDNIDYIYGYCTHILTDYYDEFEFWAPNSQNADIVRHDVERIESMLSNGSLMRTCIIPCLARSRGVSLEGIIRAEEVDMSKDGILKADLYARLHSKPCIVRYPDFIRFARRTAEDIGSILFTAQ